MYNRSIEYEYTKTIILFSQYKTEDSQIIAMGTPVLICFH